MPQNKFVNTLMNEALHCGLNHLFIWDTPYMHQFNEYLNFLNPDKLTQIYSELSLKAPETFSTWAQLVPEESVSNYKFVPLCYSLANELANLVYNGAF